MIEWKKKFSNYMFSNNLWFIAKTNENIFFISRNQWNSVAIDWFRLTFKVIVNVPIKMKNQILNDYLITILSNYLEFRNKYKKKKKVILTIEMIAHRNYRILISITIENPAAMLDSFKILFFRLIFVFANILCNNSLFYVTNFVKKINSFGLFQENVWGVVNDITA